MNIAPGWEGGEKRKNFYIEERSIKEKKEMVFSLTDVAPLDFNFRAKTHVS